MAKILIAEDNPAMLIGLHDIFKMEGHDVITAKNGTAAIEAISAGLQFDLVITDLQMPGADGNHVASFAKEAGIETVIINTCTPEKAWDIPGIQVVTKMTLDDVLLKVLAPLNERESAKK